MKAKKDLTQGDIFSHIWKMALPMFLGVMAHMLFNIVDGIFVSRLGIKATMAVLNYGFPLFYIPFALFNGINAGVSAILAQIIGRKDYKTAQNTLSQMWILSLLLFFIMWALYPLIMNIYIHWLKIPADTSMLTRAYVSTIFIALFFNSQNLVLGGSLRAEGNMRTQMNAMIIGTFANLFLDPFFIFEKFKFMGLIPVSGFGWGVRGAAIATVIASLLTYLYIVTFFLRKSSVLKWPLIPVWNSFVEIKKILNVSLPSMVSQSMLGFNLMAITYLATPFGQHAIAALGIGLRLDIIAVFPSLAIMTAVVALVGQNTGAKKFDRVKESIHKGLITAFLFVGGMGILAFLIRGALIGFFKPDSNTTVSAMHYLGFTTWSYGFIGLTMVSSGAFQGLGRGMPSLILTACRLFVINFSLGYILSRHTSLGEYGLHWAPLITNTLTGIVAVFWLKKYLKKII